MSSSICNYFDCTRQAIRKGYCYTHLKKLRISVHTCQHPGCGNVAIARQLCANHYKQAKKQEFKHFPLLNLHERLLYQEQFGPMLKDHIIYMTCKNSLCINVQHMQSLTQTEMLHLKLKNKQLVRNCGDNHFGAKLTSVNVEFILSQLEKGQSGTTLAEHFGVTRQLIHQIKKRTIWKHVT